MRYRSTRGKAASLSFEEVVLTGVASDGGLYVPEELPVFSQEKIRSMVGMSYQELAFEVMYPFVQTDIDTVTLRKLIADAYHSFRHPEITPLVKLNEQEYVLELFHGPTLAFKDIALQFLGRLFDHVLHKTKQHVTVIGATSGDTGSAAIEGCKDSEYINMFILHPKGRISDIQRLQMTTILADNVFNIAVESDFDFCQTTIKELFNDQQFLKGKTQFVAINSINWCRIMAQIVYYFYASFRLGGPDKAVSFSVPTGNFGDIYAGFLAKQMGLPIHKLIIATNENDILHRFLSANDYSRGQLKATLSPSMDIQVSSNFERLLFDLYDHDGNAVFKAMEAFKQGKLTVGDKELQTARKTFLSHRTSDDETCAMIRQVYDESGMVIDPHTATAVCAARAHSPENHVPMVILATAHPVKFTQSLEKSGVPVPPLPKHLADLPQRPERYQVLKADINLLKDYIYRQISS